MAEDDAGEKTEAPTPRRRQEAREEGRVAHSRDLTSACVLIGGLVLLRACGPGVLDACHQIVRHGLSLDTLGDSDPASAGHALLWAVLVAGKSLLPIFGGVVLIAIVANFLQVGFLLSFDRLMPNFGALNPIAGLGRLFQTPNLVNALLSVVKLALVCMMAYSAVHGKLSQIIGAEALPYLQAFGFGASVVYDIALRIGMLLFVLAAIDYGYQRFQFERNLRMSKQEIKEEMRSMDGDPKIKQRRRQVQVQLATRTLKKTVPKADVVVTNPTEFAVALQYDATTMRAPRVVAKGSDLMAKRIREIAAENGIPVLERKPLARALYKTVQVGQEIPEEFFSAVAEILAYVYELTRRTRRATA